MEWTDEKIETLKRMKAEGVSASRIGAHFGVTRNAVIGKLHRLDIYTSQRPPKKPHRVPPRAGIRRGTAAAPSYGEQIAIDQLPTDPLPLECVSLIDLKADQCRWPIGDPPLFCGRKACDRDAGVYCEAHAARAYAGRPIRKGKGGDFVLFPSL